MLQYRQSWCSFDLGELLDEVARVLQGRLKAQAIRAVFDIPDHHQMHGDRKLLRQAIENMLLAAVTSMPRGGMLFVTSIAVHEGIDLEIADSGPAMSEHGLRHAFDPEGNGERGNGWSMALVRHAAELHGGTVTVANCPDGGVALTLRLPRSVALEAVA